MQPKINLWIILVLWHLQYAVKRSSVSLLGIFIKSKTCIILHEAKQVTNMIHNTITKAHELQASSIEIKYI